MCGLMYTISKSDYNNTVSLCKVVLSHRFLKTTTTVNQVLPDQLCIQIFNCRLYFGMAKVVQQIVGCCAQMGMPKLHRKHFNHPLIK